MIALNLPAVNSMQAIEIALTEDVILQRLTAYHIKAKSIYSNLSINLNAVNALAQKHNALNNEYLQQLQQALIDWQPKQNLTTFTSNINHLIYLWLNALQDGANINEVLQHLKCIELNSVFGLSESAKLHCFLFDLLAETSHYYLQTKVNYVLNYDTITQLPNLKQISFDIEKTILNAEADQSISLFSIHFQLSKNNPIYSQLISNSLSKKIVEILSQNIPADCTIYFGGNLKFYLFSTQLSSEIQLNLLVAKLHRAFEQMQFIESESLLITPFIGSASYQKSSAQPNELLKNSQLALESALNNQQIFVNYTEDIKSLLTTQNELENTVLEAFDNDHFSLYFQPVVNINDVTCAGAELLLRWPESTNKNIHPGMMIEILNKTGRGKLFTRWLVNSACRYAAEIKHKHQLNLYLTLNLRAEDLYDLELPHMLLQSLALWKVEPKNIVLEVTENGVLVQNETTDSVIKQLTDSGFKLALDDFGTGFSSLSRLRTMPIDIIKIDQSFIRDITQSKDDYAIVKSIVALANSLGKELIAEGVEDKKCMQLIKKMQIGKCQGYYFAKPMPYDKFLIWAKQHG